MRSASSISVNDVTARHVAEARRNELQRRILSATVLLALALAAVYWGGPFFVAFVLLFALVMAWEWAGLCRLGRAGLFVLAATIAAPIGVGGAGYVEFGLVGAAAGGLLVYAAALSLGAGSPGWAALGPLYIGVPALAVIWLREGVEGGREIVLWLFGVVWVTDIGAYACGRLIGGRRLAPAISPNKTWAGFAGGILAAVALTVAAAALAGIADPWPLILAAVLLSVVAQGGDLFESAVKRRFGVKDIGHIIPGHGGVFDRVDGILTAAPVAAGLVLLTGGFLTGGFARWL